MVKRLRDQALAVVLSALLPMPSLAQAFHAGEEIERTEAPQTETASIPIQINFETPELGSLPPSKSPEELHLIIGQEKKILRAESPIPGDVFAANQKQAEGKVDPSLTQVQNENNRNDPSPTKGNLKGVHLLIENIRKNLPWKKPAPEFLPSAETRNNPLINEGSADQTFVPVSKAVFRLKDLSKENPAEAWAQAKKTLHDPLEKRLVVRSAAFDILKTAPLSESFPEALALLRSFHQPNSRDYQAQEWYLAREAAQFMGEKSKQLSADERNEALAALQSIDNFNPFIDEASQFPDMGAKAIIKIKPLQSVSNMAAWAIAEMGGTAPQGVFKYKSLESKTQKKSPLLSWLSKKFSRRTALAILFAAGMFIPLLSHYAQMPALKAPAAVVQVQKSAPALKGPSIKIKKPASPLEQIAKNTGDMAQAMKKPHLSGWAAAKDTLENLFFSFAPLILMVGAYFFMNRMGPLGMGSGASKKNKVQVQGEKPKARFSDIGGIDESLLEVQEIADYLKNPGKWIRAGAVPPKGALLIGPPGTGKTLLAKALAGEANASFMQMTGSDFVEMFVGRGAARVRELFNEARKTKPTIIFIDEIDAIGKARGQAGSSGDNEREQTLNQLLTSMDGFDGSDGIVVLAATNREDVLDPALTRPGRFDRKIYVGNPDVLGRKAVLAIHSGKASLTSDVNLDHIVRRTTGFSGAELAGVIDEAKRLAARNGRADVSPRDIHEAIDKMTVGIARNLAIDPEIRKKVAYHEAGHVLAGFFAGQPLANKLTIVPHGGQALGYAEPAPQDEVLTKTELKDQLVGMMGGRAAEEIIFGETSTGPGSDIAQAEDLARAMVEKLGMDETVGILTSGISAPGVRKNSEETAREMDQAVKKLTGEALAKAKTLLETHRTTLESVVSELLEKETLQKEDLERIVGRKSK